MGADLDPGATPGRADFEARLVGGKRVGTGLVHEVDRDHELGGVGGSVVAVTDGLEINLIPAMRSVLATRLPLIEVFDAVSERIAGLGQMPREDAPAVVGVA